MNHVLIEEYENRKLGLEINIYFDTEHHYFTAGNFDQFKADTFDKIIEQIEANVIKHRQAELYRVIKIEIQKHGVGYNSVIVERCNLIIEKDGDEDTLYNSPWISDDFNLTSSDFSINRVYRLMNSVDPIGSDDDESYEHACVYLKYDEELYQALVKMVKRYNEISLGLYEQFKTIIGFTDEIETISREWLFDIFEIKSEDVDSYLKRRMPIINKYLDPII